MTVHEARLELGVGRHGVLGVSLSRVVQVAALDALRLAGADSHELLRRAQALCLCQLLVCFRLEVLPQDSTTVSTAYHTLAGLDEVESAHGG